MMLTAEVRPRALLPPVRALREDPEPGSSGRIRSRDRRSSMLTGGTCRGATVGSAAEPQPAPPIWTGSEAAAAVRVVTVATAAVYLASPRTRRCRGTNRNHDGSHLRAPESEDAPIADTP